MAKQNKGSTGSASQSGLRESFGRQRRADWTSADAEVLRECIADVAKTGGAIRLGYSRDGGAYALGIYGDGDPYTLYTAPDDDIDAVLTKISNAFKALH